MNNFHDKIASLTNIPESVKLLKEADSLPLFLWGNSVHAKKVVKIFDEIGITSIAGTIVSDDYYNPNTKKFLDRYEVLSVTGAMLKYDKINVIVGYNWYVFSDLTKSLCENPFINNVFINEGISYKDFKYPIYEKLRFLDWHSFMARSRGITYEYVNENIEEFCQTYEWLEDELSRETMVRYLDGLINFRAFPLKDLFVKNQYFIEDIIKLSENEIFVDCGAFTGDTIDEFLINCSGKFAKIYALEPDDEYYSMLFENNSENKLILTYNVGAYSEDTILSFSKEGSCGNVITDGEDDFVQVEVNKIDSLVGEDNVTFIKMDIEGAEIPALHGAVATITRENPKLAICVYHKKEDLIEVPQYIKSLNPEYKFYLRAHNECAAEVVLYAVL